MNAIGWVHVSFVAVAAISGAVQLIGVKGTTRHRRLGWVYVAAMLGVNGAALSLHEDGRGFGIFHWLALASLATLTVGLFAARRARNSDAAFVTHANWMAGSYGGLVAAGVFQIATHTPEGAGTASLAAAWLVTLAGFAALYVLAVPRMVRRTRPVS